MNSNPHMRHRLKFLFALNLIIVAGFLALLFFLTGRPERSFNALGENPGSSGTAGVHRTPPDLRFEQLSHAYSTGTIYDDPHPAEAERLQGPHGRIALVLDDFGYTMHSRVIRDLLALPVPLTINVIPGLPASETVAESARALGHEVIAHVPMEPVGARSDTPPAYLHTGMSSPAVQSFLDTAALVPHASGLSNHQGSAATQDTALMDDVAAWCSRRGWYILDSITDPRTVLYERARLAGVPALRRDLYLDHDPDPVSIRASLKQAVDLANRRGTPVILIAHPHESTWDVLAAQVPILLEQGVEFVRLGDCLPSGMTAAATTGAKK